MGFFNRKSVECPVNKWTRIIFDFGKGYPETIAVTFESKGGGEVQGEYREKRYFWIFPQQPATGPLQPQMTFSRYWINGVYTVDICPKVDCMAHFS